jgi:hypothetical protein
VDRARVLLSEGSSLTAREHLSVMGPAGIDIGVAASNRLAIARFSRWCHHTVWVPRSADDPKGYLTAIAAALRGGRYDALLPTHEQAWLFAAGRHLLPADAPLAVADIEAFDLIQGKLACCRLLDEVGLPQPAWSILATADDARRANLPCWLKASFSTAGRGVRYVTSPGQAARAHDELAPAGPVIAQQPAAGTYAQVAALFSHGRLVAVHTSELAGTGADGSAAARVSVDHPRPRAPSVTTRCRTARSTSSASEPAGATSGQPVVRALCRRRRSSGRNGSDAGDVGGHLRRIAAVDDRAGARDRRVQAVRGGDLDEARTGHDRAHVAGDELA